MQSVGFKTIICTEEYKKLGSGQLLREKESEKETAVYENRMQQYRSVRHLAVRDV